LINSVVIKNNALKSIKSGEIQLDEKVIGILGGMGPEATAELFCRIIKATPAKKDQCHLRVIIDNNPKIPDRTEAIVSDGASPLPEIVRTARNLERAGADFVIMPCITAHYYYEDLKKSVEIPVLNMIELTVEVINKEFPKVRNMGIIATTGTVKTKIFDRALGRIGVSVIYPPADLQNTVMEAIYDKIKAGRKREGKKIIVNVVRYLAQRGSDMIIIGCTEASLALKNVALPVQIIDPLQILSEAAVATAMGNVMTKACAPR
jgi:aspartate racemase